MKIKLKLNLLKEANPTFSTFFKLLECLVSQKKNISLIPMANFKTEKCSVWKKTYLVMVTVSTLTQYARRGKLKVLSMILYIQISLFPTLADFF